MQRRQFQARIAWGEVGMRYGSVCSGIEAASAAWEPMGWNASFFAEIEKFPSSVLKHHYPDTPNAGDFTAIKDGDYEPIGLLVGGTPCQDFSVAGLRAGMDGARGQLTIEFANLAGRLRPRWLVWENVPGVLSIDGGRAFGTFLGLLGQLGYGVAYRVLDAQHFGVPQRRRRVFVVGHLGDWRRAAAVLFERNSMSGHPAPRREAGQEVAGTFTSRAKSGGWGTDVDLAASGYMRAASTGDVSHCLNAGGMGRQDYETETLIASTFQNTGHGYWQARDVAQTLRTPDGGGSLEANLVAHSLRGEGFDASEDGTGRGTPLISVPTLTSNGDAHSGYRDEHGLVPVLYQDSEYGVGEYETAGAMRAGRIPEHQMLIQPVAFAQNTRDEVREMTYAGALAAEPGAKQQSYLRMGMAVRRLTPRECERLQGFSDDYTKISDKTADGPRYKALGNSMAVPVMRWIGERIQTVENL